MAGELFASSDSIAFIHVAEAALSAEERRGAALYQARIKRLAQAFNAPFHDLSDNFAAQSYSRAAPM